MKNIKKMLLILAVVMTAFVCFAFSAGAAEESVVQIEITTDKEAYKVTQIAEIKVTVKNIGEEDVEKIIVRAFSDDIIPVGRGIKTEPIVYADVLKAGESVSFSYKAILNHNNYKLNILEKALLIIKEIIIGHYIYTNEYIDVFTKEINDISFGGFVAENVVQVGYEIDTKNIFSDDEIDGMSLVMSTISAGMKSNDYIALDGNNSEKVEYINNLLLDLSNRGLVKESSIQYSESDNSFSYEHINGVRSFVSLEIAGSSVNDSNDNFSGQYDKVKKYTYKSNGKILSGIETVFMYGLDKPTEKYSYFEKYDSMMREYSNKGLTTTLYCNPTINDYKTAFDNAEYINIIEHGTFSPERDYSAFCVVEDTPDINMVLKYGFDIAYDLVIYNTDGNGNSGFFITPKFFEFYYSDKYSYNSSNKLKNSVVFLFCCEGFGAKGNVNYAFAKAFERCGADVAIGFHNTVFEGYAFSLYTEFTDSMLNGFTVEESLNKAIYLYGENDIIYGNNFFPLSEYWDKVDPKTNKTCKQALAERNGVAAYPIIYGEKDKRFALSSVEGRVLEKGTDKPLKDVYVNFTYGKYEFQTKTDANGKFKTALPIGEWKVTISDTDTHRCYESRIITIERDKELLLANPFYMRNTVDYSGVVLNKETKTPVSGCGVEVYEVTDLFLVPDSEGYHNYEHIKRNGDLVLSTKTDEEGKYSFSLMQGEYAIVVQHEDYEPRAKIIPFDLDTSGYLLEDFNLIPKENTDEETEDENKTPVVASGNCGADGDNVKWALHEDGELVISGSGAMRDCYDYGNLHNELPWYKNRDDIVAVTIKKGVTTIGNSAFIDCDSLIDITISDSVTIIGDFAFYSCDNLASFTIGAGKTTIGDYAFMFCNSLTTVTFGEGETTIGDYAFIDCDSLTTVTFGEGETTIGNSAFIDCDSLTTVTFGEGETTIGNSAFGSCDSLTTVTFGEGETTIGDSAFSDCYSFTSVIFGEGETTIGDYAFSGCNSLTTVTFGEGETTIGYSAFRLCNSLTTVTFGEGETTIGDRAFGDCYSLTTVTIGDGDVTIGEAVFYNCASLTDVYYSGTQEEWKKINIGSGNGSLTNATIHYNS